MVQPLCETVWQFLIKQKVVLLCDPAVTFLAIYPNELRTHVQTNTRTQMFSTIFFVILDTRKQPESIQ